MPSGKFQLQKRLTLPPALPLVPHGEHIILLKLFELEWFQRNRRRYVRRLNGGSSRLDGESNKVVIKRGWKRTNVISGHGRSRCMPMAG
jgi:hypothetical protein